MRYLVGRDVWKGERIAKARILARRPPGELVGARFDPDRCQIDLELLINDRARVGVEIKLYARENVDVLGRRQLDRYLRNKSFHGVAYLTPAPAEISSTAWRQRSGRYLVPRDAHDTPLRRHFLWSDLYASVNELAGGRHAQPLVIAFREFLHSLGIRPFHHLVGDLGGRISYANAPASMRKDRDRIKAAMGETVRAMDGLEWEHSDPRSNGTVYTWPKKWTDPINRIWVSPGLLPGTLRIWIEFNKKRRSAALDERLPAAISESLQKAFDRDLEPLIRPVKEKTKRRSIDVQISYHALLSGLRTREKIGERIAAAVRIVATTSSRLAARYA